MHIDVITPNNDNPSATPSKDRGTAAAQHTDPNEFHLRANFRDLVTTKATRGCGPDPLQTGRITKSYFRGRTNRTRDHGCSSQHRSQGTTKRGLLQLFGKGSSCQRQQASYKPQSHQVLRVGCWVVNHPSSAYYLMIYSHLVGNQTRRSALA